MSASMCCLFCCTNIRNLLLWGCTALPMALGCSPDPTDLKWLRAESCCCVLITCMSATSSYLCKRTARSEVQPLLSRALRWYISKVLAVISLHSLSCMQLMGRWMKSCVALPSYDGTIFPAVCDQACPACSSEAGFYVNIHDRHMDPKWLHLTVLISYWGTHFCITHLFPGRKEKKEMPGSCQLR